MVNKISTNLHHFIKNALLHGWFPSNFLNVTLNQQNNFPWLIKRVLRTKAFPVLHCFTEGAIGEVFYKKAVHKNFINSQENTCFGVSFLIKLQSRRLQLYQKRDSDTGIAKVLGTSFLQNIPWATASILWYLKRIFEIPQKNRGVTKTFSNIYGEF